MRTPLNAPVITFRSAPKQAVLEHFAPAEIASLANQQNVIPGLAKNTKAINAINSVLPQLPTWHDFYRADSTKFKNLERESVHLVLCSPPYWTLKDYNVREGQLGYVADYEQFLKELDKVWKRCYEALVPGGRLVCVVGDVCLSRRKNSGRHVVVPLHASIQEHCRQIGFDNLAPIIWYKISNAKYEAGGGGSTFLGKPYEPNAVVKNDIEFILMQRKHGGYRAPTFLERCFSVISADDHQRWFQMIWSDVTGASTRQHPAPYPVLLASRLIRMFSFVGDTVFDPFLGSGTTAVAAALSGRNSIGVELDEHYLDLAINRFDKEAGGLANPELRVIR
jgi:DNA modification methylase